MEILSKDDNALSSFPALIPVDSLPIAKCLRLLEKVVEATFVHVLSSNYEYVICPFGVSFTTIISTFHISMTPYLTPPHPPVYSYGINATCTLFRSC